MSHHDQHEDEAPRDDAAPPDNEGPQEAGDTHAIGSEDAPRPDETEGVDDDASCAGERDDVARETGDGAGDRDDLDPATGDPEAAVDEGLAEAALDEVMPPEEEPVPAVSDQLVAILEAVIFASPEPISPKAIFKLLDSESRQDVEAALGELQRRYAERAGGLQIVEIAGGYQIVTRPELHEWVRRMFHERTTQRLSVQALETLAVIAYKQPITAAEITEIRGVNTSGVIGTLLERSLVKISGRKQVVGRPFLYSTTREFLDRFGLKDLGDLPKVEDMASALGFEPPAGLATEAPPPPLPLDEPATEEDQAVLSGGDEEEPS